MSAPQDIWGLRHRTPEQRGEWLEEHRVLGSGLFAVFFGLTIAAPVVLLMDSSALGGALVAVASFAASWVAGFIALVRYGREQNV